MCPVVLLRSFPRCLSLFPEWLWLLSDFLETMLDGVVFLCYQLSYAICYEYSYVFNCLLKTPDKKQMCMYVKKKYGHFSTRIPVGNSYIGTYMWTQIHRILHRCPYGFSCGYPHRFLCRDFQPGCWKITLGIQFEPRVLRFLNLFVDLSELSAFVNLPISRYIDKLIFWPAL